MFENKIGCALFFNEKTGENGIAYSDEGKYLKISNFEKLPKNIIWVTNISEEFLLKNNFKNIKAVDYLGIKLESIIYQMGFSFLKSEDLIKELYKIVKKTIKILEVNYSISLDKRYIHQNLSDKFTLDNLNNENKDVENILKDINSNIIITNEDRFKNEKQAYLFFPRYDYNRKLCKTVIPVGKWVTIPEERVIKKSSYWFQELSESHNFLCFCKIINLNEDLQKLLPSKYSKNKIWINNYEYSFLSKFSNIFVEKILICKDNSYLESYEEKRLFKLKSYERSSFSNGLAAYNYINAFIKNHKCFTLSSWLRIYDKCKMLEIALIFSKLNIKVISYGAGGILISFTDDRETKETIVKVCEQLNLFYPMIFLK